MSDSGGAKRGGQGRGRGRGRGGGGRGGTPNKQKSGSDGGNKNKGNRGTKSLMDLSFQDQEDWGKPPSQNPGYPAPPNTNFYPPQPQPYHQGPYYPHPPNQGPYYQYPAGQPPYYQGPPGQAPPYQGPPGQAPPYQAPPGQAPPYQAPPGQAPPYQAPPGQAPFPNQYPPPPSYEESVGDYDKKPKPAPAQNKSKGGGKGSERGASKGVSVEELVKTLAMFEGQMANTEIISKQVESTPEEVEKVVKQRKDLFGCMKDGSKTMVELVPNIKLCSFYLSDGGCKSRDTCQALHLCKSFIVARCDQGPGCPFGHKLDTNHNSALLSKMYLDLIKTHNLLNVIRKVCRGNAPPKVCGFYSTENGCRRKDNCTYLHVCKDYVMNDGKCPTKDCKYNHQLTNKQCKNVLTQHGMSTNESIRDILTKLKLSMEKSSGIKASDESGREKTGQKDRKKESSEDSDSDTSQTPSEASVKKKKNKNGEKTKEKDSKPGGKADEKSSTIKSTDFHGDVETPEICIFAVNNKCINEKKGCKYLHAKSLFHWQLEKKNKWYNFRIFQSKALENAYRDVSKNSVILPSIDADKLSSEDKKILDLLGQSNWKSDFKQMCIVDPANNTLKIRRVSTPSSAVSSLPQATVYEWHFLDQQGKWIRYGHMDSLGKQDHVCNITSEDIEKHYVSDSTTPLIISNNLYKYKIDFKSMTQTNMSSMKVREIRRRPSRLSYQKVPTTTAAAPTDATLPPLWQPMTPQQTHVLVTLDPNQPEFQEVSKGIRLMIPTATICEVRRLQNEYLWRLYQYKKADLSQRYDELTMNVQKLYHGTCSDFISGICKENIDGRRYSNTKDMYGKGTYFSNSSAVARTYCMPDDQGHLFIVQAEVIIGHVTQGNTSLTRPPPNDTTKHPYDTTVDNMTAPTIFVKYDKEEYYPEYIIEISV